MTRRASTTHATAPFDLQRALRRLRMRHLELLSLLGTENTVRAAAQRMALTQPALSKMLREVEESFGAQLFLRSRTGVVPTAAGRHLTVYATATLNGLAAIGSDVQRIAGGEAIRLRLGTFSVIPCVPRAIARLTQRAPGTTVRVQEGHGSALLSALAAGEIDCIVAALPPELLQAANVDLLRIETLYEDELCVVAAATHPLVRARHLRWDQLAGVRWALPPQESLLRRGVIDMHLRAGIVPPSPVAEMMSPVLLTQLIEQDPELLSVMRLEQWQAERRAGRVRRLKVLPTSALPPMSFITLRQPGPRDAVIAALREALEAETPDGRARQRSGHRTPIASGRSAGRG